MSNVFDNINQQSFAVNPKSLKPIFDRIPDQLKSFPRWVTSIKKVPYCSGSANGKASTAAPDTWSTFNLTQTTYEEGERDGIGFVFNGDGIVGIDLDHCVVDGQPSDAAIAILTHTGCGYVEYSQSGKGLHAYGYCSGLPFKIVRGYYNGVKTEIYNRNGFFVVTGDVYQAGSLTQYSDLQSIIDGISSGRPRLLGPVTEEAEVAKEVAKEIASVSSVSSVIFPNSCLPNGKGMRYDCIFMLARHLKNVYPLSKALELKPIFTMWWNLALPMISTKDFGESWINFLNAWDNVKHPLGSSIAKIKAGLPDRSITNEASVYGEMGANLLELCIRLDDNQRNNWNDEPFPLSCRIAGDILGINRNYANSLLQLFTRIGFLILVTKGNTVKANRYRLNQKYRKST
jgi:hypothetical protein